MTKRGKENRGSTVYQTTETLKAIFTPGASRHELKKRGLARKRITGIKTMQDYVEECVRFVTWCKGRYGLRDVRGLTPDMAEAYVQDMHDRELAGGTIGKVVSAIRKFDAGLRAKGDRPQDVPELLPPGGGWHSDRRPERVYTPQAAERIIQEMEAARDPQTPLAARLQRVAGLRIREAVKLRGVDIDVEGCTLNLEKGPKAGRQRSVAVDPEHQDFLAQMKARAESHRDGCVFQGRNSLARRVRSAVEQACIRLGEPCYSTHGFRRTFARERYKRLRAQGLDDRAARRALAQSLGHGRIQVTYSYVPKGV